jgi:hypothetical protein
MAGGTATMYSEQGSGTEALPGRSIALAVNRNTRNHTRNS